jgi:hypothetical protein
MSMTRAAINLFTMLQRKKAKLQFYFEERHCCGILSKHLPQHLSKHTFCVSCLFRTIEVCETEKLFIEILAI